MARPRGHRLSPRAFHDVLRLSNLTITELADISGVPRATLSGLAGGFYRASQTNADKIALALGVHPETLFPTMAASVIELDNESQA